MAATSKETVDTKAVDTKAGDTKAGDTKSAEGTRDRLVRAASRLMQHGGYENTPVKQLVQEAGATLGSLYHFFPGGKPELAVAAIKFGDREFAELLRAGLAAEPGAAEAVEAVAVLLAEALRTSAWADGCPVTVTALETLGRLPDVQEACAQAFDHWRTLVAAKLLACGVPEEEARDLAMMVISTLEGAELTSQVAQSPTPLLVAGRHLARLVALSVP
ncbi:TetR/AcrR family transcriptional regulator [Streptomyces sp. NBC_00536]|uniref:TetR/AcrR family transcriptional regulator n=1 Tax=Streptomyces sp. NBC_00536 TaxID=2975769 RepID=UPI002E7FE1F9|nr:TetR/AcrR family transcriptional regulator [Streptomyces sp. NBC_00536]WUC79781.1 TetR/AcrR family transcriptional regulator [Streptomyces sp. NBC_00536]